MVPLKGVTFLSSTRRNKEAKPRNSCFPTAVFHVLWLVVSYRVPKAPSNKSYYFGWKKIFEKINFRHISICINYLKKTTVNLYRKGKKITWPSKSQIYIFRPWVSTQRWKPRDQRNLRWALKCHPSRKGKCAHQIHHPDRIPPETSVSGFGFPVVFPGFF